MDADCFYFGWRTNYVPQANEAQRIAAISRHAAEQGLTWPGLGR